MFDRLLPAPAVLQDLSDPDERRRSVGRRIGRGTTGSGRAYSCWFTCLWMMSTAASASEVFGNSFVVRGGLAYSAGLIPSFPHIEMCSGTLIPRSEKYALAPRASSSE